MKLDLVHDVQSAYRKLLNSMARPGNIENLEGEAKKVDMNTYTYRGTFLIMLMLLDGEVSFNVVSKNEMYITSLVSQITYAKLKPIEEADYIFVINDSVDKELDEIFKRAKIGNLVDPNKSATIIAEFDYIEEGNNLELIGPGIKGINRISLSGNSEWIGSRKGKNEEYPLGIDAIYLDKNENVLCLPRTTQVKEKEK
ncbi:phosphonate C-P lyase system protein PhnH [Clostridium sp. LP20]|uniref:phosphonate C-P lyase system protein PhnH n=1 Tax=Clostridium sp. LP20 TaxID=3418665 RepID=UPI003EE72F81